MRCVCRFMIVASVQTCVQGKFVGVVGKVGTGKSSLLAAITAEMRKISGQVGQYSFIFMNVAKCLWFLLYTDICWKLG